MNRFILCPSTIPDAGVGCFALSHLSCGAQVNSEYGERFRKLPTEEISDEYLKYCVLLPSGLYLSPLNFLRMGVFWYINHAKEPNLVFEQSRLWAERTVESGEELTLYYSDLLTHPKNKLWVKDSDI